MSQYTLSKKTGVSEGVLSRFVRGERDITLGTLERLAPVLGLKIVADGPKHRRRQRKGR